MEINRMEFTDMQTALEFIRVLMLPNDQYNCQVILRTDCAGAPYVEWVQNYGDEEDIWADFCWEKHNEEDNSWQVVIRREEQ